LGGSTQAFAIVTDLGSELASGVRYTEAASLRCVTCPHFRSPIFSQGVSAPDYTDFISVGWKNCPLDEIDDFSSDITPTQSTILQLEVERFLHQIKHTQIPYPTVLYADFFLIQTKHVITVTMSKEYEGQDLLDIAAKAERDLNSSKAKGSNRNDTSGSDSSQF